MRTLVYNKIHIFVSCGKFYENEIYDLNEVLYDSNNEVFKVFIETEKLKNSQVKAKLLKRYLVISDSQILIFSPLIKSQNLAQLLHYSNLYLIEDFGAIYLDDEIDQKIKKKNQNLNNTYFKKFFIKWKSSDILIPNNEYIKFESPIIMKIDDYFHMNDKIVSKRKRLIQTFELFSDDYHKCFPIRLFNLYDESKLIEICMYQEKVFLKEYLSEVNPNRILDILLVYQAKEIIFFYNKIIELMDYKNDSSILIYKNKLHDFMELTGYSE